MAKTLIVSLLLVITLLDIITTKANSYPIAKRSPIEASSFVKSSCSSTTYPQTCVSSLAIFSQKIQRDHSQLALTSILVSLSRARTAHRFVSRFKHFRGLKKRELGAVKDCLEELDDAVDRLDKAAAEMKAVKSARGQDFLWHMSNLQTWVSAALTDENTCIDGFAGTALDGRVKTSIRAHARDVVEVTSNALALCNLYAQKKY